MPSADLAVPSDCKPCIATPRSLSTTILKQLYVGDRYRSEPHSCYEGCRSGTVGQHRLSVLSETDPQTNVDIGCDGEHEHVASERKKEA